MTLEDHVGDVLRKARMMAGVSLEASARAAGLTPVQLREWERSGTGAGRPDYAALGALLDLAPARLKRVAGGWLPQVPDLGRWRQLRQITTEAAGMGVHCYLAWDETTRAAALFDTGFDAAPVLEILREQGLTLPHVFITHGHSDHVAGLDEVRQAHPDAIIHQGAVPARTPVLLGKLRVSSRATPGHAADGVTYVLEDWPDRAPAVAVVGDALFAGSMGGAEAQGALAKSKVRKEILSLPDATLICPGHGPLTTVGEEKAENPFFA
jgi:glyoxylase-like metal-dependent hydrolase (beta-lactamase superfamily II)